MLETFYKKNSGENVSGTDQLISLGGGGGGGVEELLVSNFFFAATIGLQIFFLGMCRAIFFYSNFFFESIQTV